MTVDLDAVGKERWNDTYVISDNPNLWGDPPVPFTLTAADIFAADSARTVIDLPCGDGRNIPPLASRFPTVVGADSSANAIGLCAERVKKAGLDNVLLQKTDIFATSFADDMFDGVLCCEVLGHLREPVRALRELLRITRPGHHVVTNIFAHEDSIRGEDNLAAIGENDYLFYDRIFFRFYDEAAARDLCAKVDDLAEVQSIEFTRWMDPPHERYREYEHEHASWLLVLRKRG